jgi:HK97 gp10 family phage protein
MPSGETTHIAGLSELHKLLQELPSKVEGNIMRGALRAGQKVVEAEVKARVPVDDGDLRDSVRIRFHSRSQKFGWVRMHLTAGSAKAWYARLVEYGTASYYTGHGKSVGRPYEIKPTRREGALYFGGVIREKVIHPGIRPQSYMRSGFDAAQQPALDAVVAYLRMRIPKEFKKAGK